MTAKLKSVFSRMYKTAGPHLRKLAERYGRVLPSPLSEPDDLEQHAAACLWQWVKANPDKARAIASDRTETLKFLQHHAACRIKDYFDVLTAQPRDISKTRHASARISDEHGGTYMDMLAAREVHGLDAALQEAIENCRSSLARRLVAVMADPPLYVRESFWQSRLGLVKGQARLTNAQTRWGESKLRLETEHKTSIHNGTVTWTGPLETGELETSLGEASIRREAGNRGAGDQPRGSIHTPRAHPLRTLPAGHAPARWTPVNPLPGWPVHTIPEPDR